MARAPASDTPLPEPDRRDDAPHPRHAPRVFGHAAAEADLLDALANHRLHHAWLITGPQGIGKATLAWRIARFLLATPPDHGPDNSDALFGAPPPPDSLDIPDAHPVAHRVAALSEPRLFLLRRGPNQKGDRLMDVISVDETRKLGHFFHMSATDGGRRVVIVDAADEMTRSSANAILKLLEEPPRDAILLLIAHQPSRLLPTIRSRCRVLRLSPLDRDDMTAALVQIDPDLAPDPTLLALAQGSVGTAVELAARGGPALYAGLVGLIAGMPDLDRAAALALAGQAKEDEGFSLILSLTDTALARLARTGATGTPPDDATEAERALFARHAPDLAAARTWAGHASDLTAQARRGRAVNLDPVSLLLDMFHRLQDIAAQVAAAKGRP